MDDIEKQNPNPAMNKDISKISKVHISRLNLAIYKEYNMSWLHQFNSKHERFFNRISFNSIATLNLEQKYKNLNR